MQVDDKPDSAILIICLLFFIHPKVFMCLCFVLGNCLLTSGKSFCV